MSFESNKPLGLILTLFYSNQTPLPHFNGHTQVVAQWAMILQLRSSAQNVVASKHLPSLQHSNQAFSSAQSAHGVWLTHFLRAFDGARERAQPMVWRGELGYRRSRKLRVRWRYLSVMVPPIPWAPGCLTFSTPCHTLITSDYCLPDSYLTMLTSMSHHA